MNAPTESTTPWWTEVDEATDVIAILDALGIRPTNGKGDTANWALPHAMCAGAHGDGRGAVFFGKTKTQALHCRKCGQSFGAVATIALALGRDLPAAPWSPDDADIEAIRGEAEVQGWCTPRPQGAFAPRKVRRRGKSLRPTPAPASAAAPILSQASLDQEFIQARAGAPHWRPQLAAWCQARGWSDDIVRVIAGDGEAPVPGVAFAGEHSPTLLRYARAIDRELLFAVQDAHGAIRSASRRWARPGQPTDGRPKAMALSTRLVGSTTWPDRCRAFGSIPAAVDAVSFGGRIYLVEGSPDYLVAQALCRLGFGDAAIGAESAGGLRRIAVALAAQLRARNVHDVEIWCIPDVKRDRGDAQKRKLDGQTAMRAAGEALAGVATVREVLLQVPEGRKDIDLSDVAAMHLDAAALYAEIAASSTIIFEAFPDTLAPAAEGYLPPLALRPGQVTVLQASLGAGKTYRIGEVIDQLRADHAELRVIAINHRRALSRQAAGRFSLTCYEDLNGVINESSVICLNSLTRVSKSMHQAPQAVIIDEIESVCRQLFGDTLAHYNPERTRSADVALILKGLLRNCLRAGGQVIFADAHAHPETISALLRFCDINTRPTWVRHITPAPLDVRSYPSEAALVEAIQLQLEDGKRIALATDSRRRADDVAALLDAKGHRVKLYTGGMCATRRAELADVETAWARQHADVIIYTPAVDAGVNHDPADVADRVDAVFGLFTGSARLGAASIQQMMFRCRHVNAHHIYLANRDDTRSCALDDIRTELYARTCIAEERIRATGAVVPMRALTFSTLLEFEIRIERVARLRAKRLRSQVEAMYTVRAARLTHAEDLSKAHKRHINQQLRKKGDEAAELRAQKVLGAKIMAAEAYDLARCDHNVDEQTACAIAKSRLVRQFGAQHLDAKLAARDERGRVTRQSRNVVSLRLALDGHWRTLAERDRLALLDGHGAPRSAPDLPVLAGMLRCMAPEEWLLRVVNPSPADMLNAIPDFEWDVDSLRSGAADAIRLLHQVAQAQGVHPDELLRGISAKIEDLLEKPSVFFNAVLSWAGLARESRRQRLDGRSPIRVYRVDAKRLDLWSIRCLVETARQRGIAVDPLEPTASPFQRVFTASKNWRAPTLGNSKRLRYVVDDAGNAWILSTQDPPPGSPRIQSDRQRVLPA